MEKEHIQGAKEQASLVVDGLSTIRYQQTRDVFKLVVHIEN